MTVKVTILLGLYLVKQMDSPFNLKGFMYVLCPYCGGSGEFGKFDDEGDRIPESCSACQGAGHIPQNWYQDYMEHQKN